MKIQQKQAHTTNYRIGRTSSIRYIVMHYTANNGDTARGNCNYFAGSGRKASAHYFVDDNSVWQSVKDGDTAWHCGGGLQGKSGHTFYGQCKNSNALGIEMCSRVVDGTYVITAQTVENAVELVRILMDKYNIPPEWVIRHYDVTGKLCPRPWVEDDKQWQQFKNRLQKEEISMTTAERQEYDAKIQQLGERISKLENPNIYNYIDQNMPEWAREAVGFFCEKGILVGNGAGLGLSDTKLWTLTILYRVIRKICPVQE